jgi:hypothetical protein
LAKGDVLKGESRSIGDQRVDEHEEVRDPGHCDILTQDHNWSRLGPAFPLWSGFRAAHEVFSRHSRNADVIATWHPAHYAQEQVLMREGGCDYDRVCQDSAPGARSPLSSNQQRS